MFHTAWKNKDTGMIEDIDYEMGIQLLKKHFLEAKKKSMKTASS